MEGFYFKRSLYIQLTDLHLHFTVQWIWDTVLIKLEITLLEFALHSRSTSRALHLAANSLSPSLQP